MNVQNNVRDFYDNYGWKKVAQDRLGEDSQFRQFSPPYYKYPDAADRTLSCFGNRNGRLLIAGGGDLPDSHIRIASNFSDVSCLDISHVALEIAKSKLKKSTCVLGSILDAPFPDGHFDAIFCAHVIYHIDIKLQERAVNELIRAAKPGGRIVIIYTNPNSVVGRIAWNKKKVPLLRKLQRKADNSAGTRPYLYYSAHPLSWWSRFEMDCKISFLPWDVMSSEVERELLWNDAIASMAYRAFHWFEKKSPRLAVKCWQYTIIILDKRK